MSILYADRDPEILPGAPLPLTGYRQRDRENARKKGKMESSILSVCKKNPMAQAAFDMGYNQGLQKGCEFSLKDAYAASLLAANEVYRFGRKRNKRLLKKTDEIVVHRLTTEELIDEVFERFGIRIDFNAPFDRVEDAE